MTFILNVDTEPWRTALDEAVKSIQSAITGLGGVVPVIKGNGYGLGNPALAREASRLKVTAVAVGTVFEAAEVAAYFGGDVVVLEPYEPRDLMAAAAWSELDSGDYAPRLIKTIASNAGCNAAIDLAKTTGRPTRVVVEGLTSMHRFGLDESEVAQLLADDRRIGALTIEGLALHLPLVQPTTPRTSALDSLHDDSVGIVALGSARAREVIAWSHVYTTLLADQGGSSEGDLATTLWVSHLDVTELASVRAALPDTQIRARAGTRLWHGSRSTLRATGTVLAVHVTDRAVGYRQRRPAKDGVIIVVSGGTSHGVAMSAPSSVTSLKARVNVAGSAGLEALGKARSPFTLHGEQLWFVEPPHISVSMLRLPKGMKAPAVGDDIACELRFTTSHADTVRWL